MRRRSPWRAGDRVLIERGGRRLHGVVETASPTGDALMLRFARAGTVLGEYLHQLPVVWTGSTYVDALHGVDVVVAPRDPPRGATPAGARR